MKAEPPIHPAAEIFPLLVDDGFKELMADIKARGLLEPIVLLDGAILDGRNRYQACVKAGVEPRFVTYTGTMAPVEYVRSRNLHRRHLTPSQRAACAAKATALLAEEKKAAKARQREHGKTAPGRKNTGGTRSTSVKSRDRVGKSFGVSGRSVSKAQRVAEASKDLLEQVAKGDLTLGQAAAQASIIRQMGEFPKDEHAAVDKFVEVAVADGTPPAMVKVLLDNVAAMPTEERVRVYSLAKSDKPRERVLALTEAAKIPPVPHPGITPLRDVLHHLSVAVRAGVDRQWCSDIRRQIEAKINQLKEEA
jgi:hypothetical protein